MSIDQVRQNMEAFQGLHIDRLDGDFLLTRDKTIDEIKAVALVADAFARIYQKGGSLKSFATGLAVAIFRDQSTRTRYSFASAADMLGLSMTELDEGKSQIAHGETVRETATMISFGTEAIGIRDDLFLGVGNRYMQEVAAALDAGFSEGSLHRRPTIVNLQCDVDHPTQTMADLLKLKHRFGSFEALAGKKIVMSWAYSPSYGKPLSVPQGIISLMTRFGMDVVLAAPEGYGLIPEVEAAALANAAASGGRFIRVADMDEAFRDADVVYPKSWASYDVMVRRAALFGKGDEGGLGALEKECLAENERFVDWECTSERMNLTRDAEALYMHCLPADISGVSCERGEVEKAVFEKYRFDTYQEAGFKPFVIAAMIFLAAVRDPVGALATLAARDRPRIGC